MKYIFNLLIIISFTAQAQRAWHVSTTGSDKAEGAAGSPLRTIQAAAQKANPGDRIIVHAGIYRERIDPPRGGTSDAKRITYEAAPGEHVEIRGSEKVNNWIKYKGNVWELSLPNKYFGGFNPFADIIHGDWYDDRGYPWHTGNVYLDGTGLVEAASLDTLSSKPRWFCKTDADSTHIWANFGDKDPRKADVEINKRRTVFYPSKTGINYLTIKGFTLKEAATPWAPPTAEQPGLIGTNWSKGWIIENNDVSYSKCVGISLGKYGDKYDNTSQNSAEGYVETVKRALANGWNKETIGHHIVRDNHISFCEQAGIVGSLGCSFSQITGNVIHDVHMDRLFSGAEMAAIKFHGAVDVLISRNTLYHNSRGIWLDWMGQGARISKNLMYDHDDWDIYFEVDHGPIVMDNNICLSRRSQNVWAQGVTYVHNLIAGQFDFVADGRETPVLTPHGTRLISLERNPIGDLHFYNNIFVGKDCTFRGLDRATLAVTMDGNVYVDSAAAPQQDKNATLLHDPYWRVETGEGRAAITMDYSHIPASAGVPDLGTTAVTNEKFEDPNGQPFTFDTDWMDKRRSAHPCPGPFEIIEGGIQTTRVL